MLNDSSKSLDEKFMMHLFDKIVDELPEFQEHLQRMHEEKNMLVVGGNGTKVVPMAMLCKEMFDPVEESNQETTEVAKDLGKMVAEAMLQE